MFEHLKLFSFSIFLTFYTCQSAVFNSYQNEALKYSSLSKLSNPSKQSEETCGYKQCDLGEENVLNVHIVAHTHDDVGWLKTVDEYFYGNRNDIQHAGVQYILDNVMDELEKDEKRKFIYVEIAFFYRWWRQQDADKKEKVRKFVSEGRLEFILGGWCMNDEAATHYNSIIDQHTLGFRLLMEEFGTCARPKIGWQIDPFGHSREQASLFAQFGFDALYFGRLDYQDKANRQTKKTMELLWKGSGSLNPAQTTLFTGVLYNGYGPPNGFCFDRGCDDSPIMDDKDLEDYNVEEKVKSFADAARDWAKPYRTNHILMTMGSDFQFEEARANYKNLDKLIQHVNARKDKYHLNLFYSTPSCYTYAVNKANLTFTAKTDDFFPYASRAHTFWSGYFTSRPALKRYERFSNNVLQACKQLASLDFRSNTLKELEVLKEAMGVNQHHDAVSGTEKQHVSYDYAKRLARGSTACYSLMGESLGKIMGGKKIFSCPLLNVSNCDFTVGKKEFTAIIYNPLAKSRDHWVRIPVLNGKFEVIDESNGASLDADVVPLSEETKNLPEYKLADKKAIAELLFKVALPPIGSKSIRIKEVKLRFDPIGDAGKEMIGSPFVVENSMVSVAFSSNGLISKISNLESKVSTDVKQTLSYYLGYQGDNTLPIKQSSGAYIFRSNGSSTTELTPRSVKVYPGKHYDEVRQQFSDWAWQTIRIYDNAKHVEIEWTIGPIPIKDKLGKEVISKFSTNIASGETFYTDANGREILERKRDFRSTWDFQQTEAVAGNYYPVNSRIFIKDNNKQLTVMTDRSHGGSSLKSGELEVMLHRRLLRDDAFGVGEPLNEPGLNMYGPGLVTRGTHYILLDTPEKSVAWHRQAAPMLYLQPLPFFTDGTVTKKEFSAVKNMDKPVHLLTLEPISKNVRLVRLEHIYEKSEFSQNIQVSLKDVFPDDNIVNVEETALGGDRPVGERLVWKLKGGGSVGGDMRQFLTPVTSPMYNVLLTPMQIRTFLLNTAIINDINIVMTERHTKRRNSILKRFTAIENNVEELEKKRVSFGCRPEIKTFFKDSPQPDTPKSEERYIPSRESMVILSSGDTQSSRLSLLDKTLQNFEPKANSTVLLNQSMFMDVSPVDGDVLDKLPMFDLNTSPTDNKSSPLSEFSPVDTFRVQDENLKPEKSRKTDTTVFCNSPMEMATPVAVRAEKKAENTYNMSVSMDITLQDKKKVDPVLDLSAMSMDISSEELRLDKTKKETRMDRVENFFSDLTKTYSTNNASSKEVASRSVATIEITENVKEIKTKEVEQKAEKIAEEKASERLLEKVNAEIRNREQQKKIKTSPIRSRKMMSTPCVPNPNDIDLSLSVIDGPENEKVDLITPQVVEDKKGETVPSRTMSYVRAALKEEQQIHKEIKVPSTTNKDREKIVVENDVKLSSINKPERNKDTYLEKENKPARNKWGGENFYDELDTLCKDKFPISSSVKKTKYSLGDIHFREDKTLSAKSEEPFLKRSSVPSSLMGHKKKEFYQTRPSEIEKEHLNNRKISESNIYNNENIAEIIDQQSAPQEQLSTTKDSASLEIDTVQKKVDATFVINPLENNKDDKENAKTTEVIEQKNMEDVDEVSLDMEESSKFALSENSLLTDDDSCASLIKLPKLSESFLVKSALHSSCRKGQLSEEQKKWRRILIQLKDDRVQHEEDCYVWSNALRKDKSLRRANDEISRLRSNRQRSEKA
ncbi:DgyrCDS10126 [Dimorphilus gyrociliatus]|uniref:alpha-mannosidase n=1 Tax=Dimorphilus gyrociliatus TaxID=2664684 RepID=A0A7I8W4C5_9ANNE|nr:DgyrCDS10126 [Dimorphilus gyrociliatus]